jgi:hypothetical protein
MLRILEQRDRTLRKFLRKQCFIVLAHTQWSHVQKLSPENKGALPYIAFQAENRSEKQSLTHIWLSAIFIGYFILSAF